MHFSCDFVVNIRTIVWVRRRGGESDARMGCFIGVKAGHILSSRLLQLHENGNRPIDNAATAHFILHISILQLHILWSTAR